MQNFGGTEEYGKFESGLLKLEKNIQQHSKHGCQWSGNGQGKNSSRSGKCQGMLFWVGENWYFEESQGKLKLTDLIPSKVGAKDCCNQRLEVTTIS